MAVSFIICWSIVAVPNALFEGPKEEANTKETLFYSNSKTRKIVLQFNSESTKHSFETEPMTWRESTIVQRRDRSATVTKTTH